MNARSERTAVSLLLAALIASPALIAREHGLNVDPSAPHPCKYAASRARNDCTPAAVVRDLHRYFLSGKPFRLEAVAIAVHTGRIRLAPDALAAFNEGIVAICVFESPHDFEAIKTLLYYLPHSHLRQRLTSELAAARQPAIRARLQEALSALPRSVADAAIRAYRLELYEAGGDKCHAAVERVARAMAIDSRLSDASIQAEIDLYEKHKGPMPYPSAETACELFGFQSAAHLALEQRRK